MLKRALDVLLVLCGLLLSSWAWILIGLIIVITGGFPVFIKQKRIGKGGRLFPSYKFRSMVKSALHENVRTQASQYDPRVTWFGKFLRRTALDELPQLLNILIGDMSFVGPRALLPEENEINGEHRLTHICEIPGYSQRCTAIPGLTGIAQIYAPRDLPRKYKFKYDMLYIRKQNLCLDIKLIVLSFLITLRGNWETRGHKLTFLHKNNMIHQSQV